MIENGLPLPDDDLMDPPNPNVKHAYGCYVETKGCVLCRYFQVPDEFPRAVCPECGRKLEYIVGRFKIRTECKRFLFSRYFETTYIGFVPGKKKWEVL